MDKNFSVRKNYYDRVMPRVYNRTNSHLKSSNVIRHETPTSSRNGAKTSAPNLNCSTFKELPLVLDDYKPDVSPIKPENIKSGAKPKKTLKSLDPVKSPHTNKKNVPNKVRSVLNRNSTPSVIAPDPASWSDSHLRQCFSSRSHTRLKELKNEIKEFQDTQKFMQMRCKLYKKCGIVLDDVGQIAVDRAVEVEEMNKSNEDKRTERDGEDAGAVVSDQQMRYEQTLYPVDRYLVESSKKDDMINIIDDIWNSEPALRPEDEIILRKLHDMLQSTADDLKLLSGELCRYHEPGVQKMRLPTPLDEEFNEKVHIEEVVNAKFHGHKLVNNIKTPTPYKLIPKDIASSVRFKQPLNNSRKKVTNASVQVNEVSSIKNTPIKKNLGISRTKTLQIYEELSTQENQLRNTDDTRRKNKFSKVAFNEYSYKQKDPKIKITPQKSLQVQEMPSISIRSQLKEQKVLQLDIQPDETEIQKNESVKSNALVIDMKYEPTEKLKTSKPVTFDHITLVSKKPIEQTKRKISIIPAYETSDSTNNISSESQGNMTKQKSPNIRSYSIPGRTQKSKKNTDTTKNVKLPKSDLNDWKNKLKVVYGRAPKNSVAKIKKVAPKQTKSKNIDHQNKTNKVHNTEYIPYSKLTLGGVSVTDIEREISNIPNRNDLVLSPILDKILTSRENSFNKDSPTKLKNKSSKILTTSDENLLQEVLDIEKHVTETLSGKNSNENKTSDEENVSIGNKNSEDSDSYIDDFEDDKSENSKKVDKIPESNRSHSVENSSPNNFNNDIQTQLSEGHSNRKYIHDKTFTKVPNLSYKNKVDIFEFVHYVDTQDIATQSRTTNKIKLQETQTSPRNDLPNVQSIRNDLWSSIDPRGEVEKLFELEKDFIKKLIIDEYGDILEKGINKESTSKDESENVINIATVQKNTQTSPTHVKSVMTSPTRTKTRTTSPLALSLTVNKQTSPLLVVSNDDNFKVEIKNAEDLGISVNLSSPRFSLRLPQTTRDILSNFEAGSNSRIKKNNFQRNFSSSSSVDGDYSSSDISSLGEIHKKYKRRLRKINIPSISDLSSSSSFSRCSTGTSGAILPLRSDGEASVGQINKKSNKVSRSEGEVSLGQWK